MWIEIRNTTGTAVTTAAGTGNNIPANSINLIPRSALSNIDISLTTNVITSIDFISAAANPFSTTATSVTVTSNSLDVFLLAAPLSTHTYTN